MFLFLDEAPTVVLDRIDITSNPQDIITLNSLIPTPDPFRDVIRTESPPNLQSLIGDIPYFSLPKVTERLNSTTPLSITEPTTDVTNATTTQTVTELTKVTKVTTPTTQVTEEEFSFDKMLELFFAEETTTTTKTTTTDDLESRIVNSNLDNRLNYIPIKFPTTIKPTTLKPTTKTTTRPSTTLRTLTTVPRTTTTVRPTTVNATTTAPLVTTVETTEGIKTTQQDDLSTQLDLDQNNQSNHLDAAPNGVGLLKLAGCNIYGRMYRVGRIISELSGPCLECMCTHIGVQCKALKC